MGKIEHSNSNKQCCVPQCKSRCTNEISLFRFPKDETQRKKWTDAIKIEKGVTQNMQVCSRHFVKNDYIITDIDGSKVKRLKRTAVPSQNLPWQFPNKRVSPTLAKARMERLKNRSQQKISDSPLKSESSEKPDDVKKSEGSNKTEDNKKPESDVKSEIEKADSLSENLEDTEPKNEDMSDEDDKVTEKQSLDVKDEKEDETEEHIEEGVEENGGEATEAKKDENNMSRAPTRLRQRKGVLKCEHCGRKCLSPQALQTHQQTAHKNARNNLINLKKEPTQSSPKPVALISVKSTVSLQNFPKKPLEKSLNSSEVEKVLQEDLGSDSDVSVKEEIMTKEQCKTEFQCPLCKRRFDAFYMANRHIQKHHSGLMNGNNSLLPKPARVETCTRCHATLERGAHACAGPLASVHLASGFTCTGCEQEYRTLTLFDMHKSSRHNDGVESMFFPSLDEFEVWKQKMQSQTRSKYTALEHHDMKKVHRCSYRTERAAARQRMCPSAVVVQEFTKGFQVHYYPHHYGHAYEKYNLGKAFKKYYISSLMNRTASKLPDSDDDEHDEHDEHAEHDEHDEHDKHDAHDVHEAHDAHDRPAEHDDTDLYLQFQKITSVLVNEAARINVNGLKKLMRKALDMIAIVNSYVEDEDDDFMTSSVIKLDPDKDDLQDQVKKALLSLKRPGEIVEVTPVKRRKSVFQSTENTLKAKEVILTLKDEKTEKEPLKSNQSPSFIDTFQDFVGKALVKPVLKKRPSEKTASAVKTKIGQFKPKSPLAKASLSPKSPLVKAISAKGPLVKAISPKSPLTKAVSAKSPLMKAVSSKNPVLKAVSAKTPLLKDGSAKTPLLKAGSAKTPLLKAGSAKTPLLKAVSPKSPLGNAVSPKSPLMKAVSAKSPLVKAVSAKSPKTNVVSSRRSGVKDIKYEVKEQENDCNILILKI